MQSTLIPLYRTVASLGVVNSLIGLILIYLGGAVFCYFLIVGYMRKLPMDVLEAARIDGANPFRIYRSIVLPLITPILTTVVVFQTLATWDDFLWPNVLLSSTENRTIVLQVYNAVGQFSTNWPHHGRHRHRPRPRFFLLPLLPALDSRRARRSICKGMTQQSALS
jgi:raffinose/stachyose/melibiose transport system permease protein